MNWIRYWWPEPMNGNCLITAFAHKIKRGKKSTNTIRWHQMFWKSDENKIEQKKDKNELNVHAKQKKKHQNNLDWVLTRLCNMKRVPQVLDHDFNLCSVFHWILLLFEWHKMIFCSTKFYSFYKIFTVWRQPQWFISAIIIIISKFFRTNTFQVLLIVFFCHIYWWSYSS